MKKLTGLLAVVALGAGIALVGCGSDDDTSGGTSGAGGAPAAGAAGMPEAGSAGMPEMVGGAGAGSTT